MKGPKLTPDATDQVIRLAWHDRTSFEAIQERLGLSEDQVIQVMRRELKASSFRLWRKRVTGRVTKHRKQLKKHLRGEMV